jgi:hypothetical protein
MVSVESMSFEEKSSSKGTQVFVRNETRTLGLADGAPQEALVPNETVRLPESAHRACFLGPVVTHVNILNTCPFSFWEGLWVRDAGGSTGVLR